MKRIEFAKKVYHICPNCLQEHISIYAKYVPYFDCNLLCVECKDCGQFIAYNSDGQEIIYGTMDECSGIHCDTSYQLENELFSLSINPHGIGCEHCTKKSCKDCPNCDLYANYSFLKQKQNIFKKKYTHCEKCNTKVLYKIIPVQEDAVDFILTNIDNFVTKDESDCYVDTLFYKQRTTKKIKFIHYCPHCNKINDK